MALTLNVHTYCMFGRPAFNNYTWLRVESYPSYLCCSLYGEWVSLAIVSAWHLAL